MTQKHDELFVAYYTEKNAKTKERMHAVYNIVSDGLTIAMVARLFHKAYNTIRNWKERFESKGTSGL